MLSTFRLLGLVLIGCVVGGGYGYLRGIQEPEQFRSTTEFRVSVPSVTAPEAGSSADRGSSMARLSQAGQQFRELEVVRKAVVDGQLTSRAGAAVTSDVATIERITSSDALTIDVIGFAIQEIVIRASFDGHDPHWTMAVLQALLASYEQLHFAPKPQQVLDTGKQKFQSADELMMKLEAAEAEYNLWLSESAKTIVDGRSVEDLKGEQATLQELQSRQTRRVAELQRRLSDGAAARQAGRPTGELLSILRGETSTGSTAAAPPDEAETLSQVKRLIAELRQQIEEMTIELKDLDERIAGVTELARTRVVESQQQQAFERQLAELRQQYDNAILELGKAMMAGSSEGGDAAASTQLTLLRAPELGEPIGDSLRGHIVRGTAWGAGVVTALALLASVVATLARPRLPAPKWD
jgi:hypothetical protein